MKRTAKRHVLVVDDDQLVNKLIITILQPFDVSTTVAVDGKEAEKALKNGQKYDAIFLDLILPSISGWEILNMVRADPVNLTTHVVLMTGASLSVKENARLLNENTSMIAKDKFKIDICRQLLARILDESVEEKEAS